jgi:anti-sigma regulatory factor (Ser/Thr protein kinase)
MKIGSGRYAARIDNLPAVTEFVDACADRFGLDGVTKFGLLLAAEEAFVNICRYAYSQGEGAAELSCESEGDAFVLDISDRGRPFDVLSLPEPNTTADSMHRPLGGLGIHFIRKFANSVTYHRDDDRNVLRMVFRPTQEAADEKRPGGPRGGARRA